MLTPVVPGYLNYDVPLTLACLACSPTVMGLPEIVDWVATAQLEPEQFEVLDMDF